MKVRANASFDSPVLLRLLPEVRVSASLDTPTLLRQTSTNMSTSPIYRRLLAGGDGGYEAPHGVMMAVLDLKCTKTILFLLRTDQSGEDRG